MAVFHVRNVGGSLLRITNVKKCCGAVVKFEKSQLSPGESGVVIVEYRGASGRGPINKKVSVITNDPKNPQTELTITGELVETLTWVPTQFKLAPFRREVGCPEITIKSLDGTPFSIKGFASTGQVITVGFDPNEKATEFTLRPTIDAAKLTGPATLTGRIMVNLDHPDYRIVNIPFDVVQPLQATPRQVVVFDAKTGAAVTKEVQVQDNEADPNTGARVAIESVTAKNGSRVEVRGVTANKIGCELKLEIWPAAGKESESFSTDQLVVKLKDGRELTVPVRVFYQSPAVSSAASSVQ